MGVVQGEGECQQEGCGDDHGSEDGNGNKKDKRTEKGIDIIANLAVNSETVIDSIFDDIIDDFVEEQGQTAEIKRNRSIMSDLLVECVVCQIFDEIYY